MSLLDEYIIREIISSKIRAIPGAGVKPKHDARQLLLRYYQLMDKLFIPKRELKVVFSHELQSKRCTFNGKTQNAINNIKARLESGLDIFEYLSKGAFKTDFPDMLLRNFNIHHVRVGEFVEGQKCSEGRLFFTYHDDVVYFLDVTPHPKKGKWFPRQLLEIIYDNGWKHLFNIIEGAQALHPDLNDDEVYAEWMKGMYTMVSVRDVIIVPSNGGITSSRDNAIAVKKVDRFFRELRQWDICICEQKSEFTNYINQQTNKNVQDVSFTLTDFDDNFFYVYDTQHNIRSRLRIKWDN